jgi:hypothetical protein
MRWVGHVARMGRGEAYTGTWWGNLSERDHLRDPDEGGRMTLRWTSFLAVQVTCICVYITDYLHFLCILVLQHAAA